jgi:hypothetical protein
MEFFTPSHDLQNLYQHPVLYERNQKWVLHGHSICSVTKQSDLVPIISFQFLYKKLAQAKSIKTSIYFLAVPYIRS